MIYEIKNLSGEIIFSGDSLRNAYLYDANLESADLQSADLRWADLRSANLTDTILEGLKL